MKTKVTTIGMVGRGAILVALLIIGVMVAFRAAYAAPDTRLAVTELAAEASEVIVYDDPELAGLETERLEGKLLVAMAEDIETGGEVVLYAVEVDGAVVPVDMELDEIPSSGAEFVGDVVIEETGLDVLPVARAEIHASEIAAAQISTQHVAHVIILTPKGSSANSMDDATAKSFIEPALAYWKDNSGGKMSSFTVTGTIKRYTLSGGCGMEEFEMWAETAKQITTVGGSVNHIINVLPYECDGKTFSGPYAGVAIVGGGSLTVVSRADTKINTFVTAHELGHNHGLKHAGSVEGVDYGSSTYAAYSDYYSVMGIAINRSVPVLDSVFRDKLGLTTAGEMESVTAGAATTKTIKAISQTSGLRELKVKDPVSGHTYYVEYRSGADKDDGTAYAAGSGMGSFCFGKGVRVVTSRSATGIEEVATLTKWDSSKSCYRTYWLKGEAITVGSLVITVDDISGDTASVSVKQFGASGSIALTSYIQKDTKWSSTKIGQWTMGSTGCVPTAVAIALSGYGIKDNPLAVAKLMNKSGDYNTTSQPGASGLSVKKAIERYGFIASPISTLKDFEDHLKQKEAVVALVNPGVFSSGAYTHAIAVAGYEDGVTRVYDPLGRVNGLYNTSQVFAQRSTDKFDLKTGYVFYAVMPFNGEYLVKGEIRIRYDKLSGVTGKLGQPISNEGCGLRNSGCSQEFEKGHIYWSKTTGAWEVTGKIGVRYKAIGAESSSLGYPISSESCSTTGGIKKCVQKFEKANIYYSAATGAWEVTGKIGADFRSTGAETGKLGLPTATESCSTTGGVKKCLQEFEKGSVYYNSSKGVYHTLGRIHERHSISEVAGKLGYPISSESCSTTGGIKKCVQKFEKANIYYSAATGAWEVTGKIGARWRAIGSISKLGSPKGAESCSTISSVKACSQAFEKGSIYFSTPTGAWEVTGKIGVKYIELGAETGKLGLPTATESCSTTGGIKNCVQKFAKGNIRFSSTKGAWEE